MTSFFNKKLSLVLLVLASLMVLASVSTVSAYYEESVSSPAANATAIYANWTDDARDNRGNVSEGTILKVNGSVTNGSGSTTPSPQGNITLIIKKSSNGTVYRNYSFNLDTTAGNFNFDIDTLGFDPGLYRVIFQYENGSSSWEPMTSTANAFIFRILSTPFVEINPVGTTRVGVPTNVTVNILYGGLQSKFNSTGSWSLSSGASGIFNFTNGTYNITGVTFLSTADVLTVTFDGNGSENTSSAFNVWTGAGKGTIQNFTAWFNTLNAGYILGDTATIHWSFNSTGYNLTGKYVIIQFFDKGVLQHTLLALAADYNVNYTWKKTHDNLTMYVTLPADANYETAQAINYTFVDLNSTRRTTIDVEAPVNGSTLKVGVNGTIKVKVYNFNGTDIQQGTVLIQFDNYDPFTVDIINGTATFDHVYKKAGAARLLQVTYLGDNDNKASYWNKTVSVAKGDANISVTMVPPTTLVGVPNTINVLVTGITDGPSTPRTVTIKFIENGILQHTEKVTLTVDNTLGTGVGILTYAFKKTHSNLQIVAELVADNDYNVASGTLNTMVTA